MSRRVDQVFDEMLVLLAMDGRVDALNHLARRWRPRHYVHARRLLARADLAADAVQEAWISIIRNLWRLKEPGRFPAWSYAIVTHRCQDSLRRVSRSKDSELDDALEDPAPRDLDTAADLRRALQTLPADQRATIALYYLEGFSVSEIAEALVIPEGTVKTRLHHARRTLRKYIEGENHD